MPQEKDAGTISNSPISLKTHARFAKSRRRSTEEMRSLNSAIASGVVREYYEAVLTYPVDDENEEKIEPIASEMKLLGSARSRKGESHSGWNVVGGNDVVDTWKSGDTKREGEEVERRRGDEETHSSNE